MSRRLLILLALLAACVTGSASAQGCAQCKDNMQSTPPSVQAAYRHSIELLAISGATAFIAGVVLLRRYR